ncbi:PEP-CTERM sorting domain-containing protein [Oscillatoria sp. FACHB-1406]|nr:PEP-CTERM sorting domain-containing protein [Oscillatoria sp. FACHB-1406]
MQRCSGSAAVPEPSSMLGLGIMALGGAMLKQRTKRKALQ